MVFMFANRVIASQYLLDLNIFSVLLFDYIFPVSTFKLFRYLS